MGSSGGRWGAAVGGGGDGGGGRGGGGRWVGGFYYNVNYLFNRGSNGH